MSTLTLFWIAIGIIFLIVEIVTVSFYGLSLAVAAFVTAVYVAFVNPQDFGIIQGVVFVVIATIFSYILPKWLSPEIKDTPQGLDMYIGESRKTRQVHEDLKIKLDGVDYIVIGDDEPLSPDKDVTIIARKGSIFYAIPQVKK